MGTRTAADAHRGVLTAEAPWGDQAGAGTGAVLGISGPDPGHQH